MFKKNLVLLLIVLITILSGCTDSAGKPDSSYDDSSDTIIFDGHEATYSDGKPCLDFKTRYTNIKNKYPDKTILIWASEQQVRYEEEVNEYLAESGCDYVICFKNLMYDLEINNTITDENGKWTTSYSKEFEKCFNNSDQIDIVSTEMMYIGYDGFINAYQYFINHGWLLPIDEYLENSEAGKEFYNSAPKNYWESLRYNKHIYGFDGSTCCFRRTLGYEFNADLCKQLKIDFNDFKGSYIDTLNKIFDICQKNDLMFSTICMDYVPSYTEYDFLTSGVYINNEGKAENIYENKEIEKLYDLIADSFHKGYNTNNPGTIDSDHFLGITRQRICGEYLSDGIKLNDFFSSISSISEQKESYQIFPKCFNKIFAPTSATGICTSSKHPELAFNALAKIMTDKKLNNLICYGTDYEIVDNCISPKGHYNTMDVGNRFVEMPMNGFEFSDVSDRLETAFKNSTVSKYVDFAFDTSKVYNQVRDTEKIISEIKTDFPSEKYTTGKDYLKKLNKKLYDAGMQDILDEANRQLAEFHKSHS